MSCTDREKLEFLSLLNKSMEGRITPEEVEQLNELMFTFNDLKELYLKYIELQAVLYEKNVSADFNNTEIDSKEFLLHDLVMEEENAPAFEILDEVDQPNQDDASKKHIAPIRLGKFYKIYSSIISIAAVIMITFIVYYNLFPPYIYMPAATVSSQVNAEWYRDGQVKIKDGSILYTGPMSLKKGLAEIVLNNGTEIILEGPCEFNIESDRQIYLHSGSIVANIENVADKRFVVRTDSATVVDYGTEFGVNVDHLGNTSTEVFQGTVELRQGSDPLKFDKKLRLEKSQGGRVTKQGKVSNHINDYAFVRSDQLYSELQAAKGSAYYKWKAYSYKLKQRDDLLAYYTFENIENGMLANSAWNTRDKYHGKLMSYTAGGNLSELVEGRWPQKKAMKFVSKEQQYISIDSDKALNIGSNITLSAWVKLDTLDNGGHILSNRLRKGAVNYQLGYNLLTTVTKNRIQFARYLERSSTCIKYSRYLDESEVTGWHHIAVSHDSHNARFYFDAELIDVVEYATNISVPESDFVIGSDMTNDGMFNGLIGEIAIFDSILNASDIAEMYEVGTVQ